MDIENINELQKKLFYQLKGIAVKSEMLSSLFQNDMRILFEYGVDRNTVERSKELFEKDIDKLKKDLIEYEKEGMLVFEMMLKAYDEKGK